MTYRKPKVNTVVWTLKPALTLQKFLLNRVNPWSTSFKRLFISFVVAQVTAESDKNTFVYQGFIHGKDFGKFQFTRQGMFWFCEAISHNAPAAFKPSESLRSLRAGVTASKIIWCCFVTWFSPLFAMQRILTRLFSVLFFLGLITTDIDPSNPYYGTNSSSVAAAILVPFFALILSGFAFYLYKHR